MMDKTISSTYFKALTQCEKTVKDLNLWVSQELKKLEDTDLSELEGDYEKYLDGRCTALEEVLDFLAGGK